MVGVGELGIGLLSVGQGSADLGELRAWACCDGDDGSGQRTGRDNAPGEHAAGYVSVFSKELTGLRAYVAARMRGTGRIRQVAVLVCRSR